MRYGSALVALWACATSEGLPLEVRLVRWVKAPDDLLRQGPSLGEHGRPSIGPGSVAALPRVESAVRQALAAHPQLTLARHSAAAVPRLDVRLAMADVVLEPFADRGRRANPYRAVVVLDATLKTPTGGSVFPIRAMGEVLVLAPPGGIEALDGALRRGIDRAAGQAARRLARRVAALLGR